MINTNDNYEIKWGKGFVRYSKINIPIANEFRLEVDKNSKIADTSVFSFPLLARDDQDNDMAMRITYFKDGHKFIGNNKISIKFSFGEVRQID